MLSFSLQISSDSQPPPTVLTSEQLQQYQNEGFLIVPDLLNDRDLNPIEAAINEKVEALAEKLYAEGSIEYLYQNESFLTRLTRLEEAFPGAATLIHTGGVLPKAIQDVWASPKLLDIMEQLLGPDIAGHPVWNLRSKTPHNSLATVPWHQDTAYLAAGSEATFQPTAWIPLVDANTLNGCMQVIRGGHIPPKVYPHKLEATRGNKDSWYLYIEEKDLPKGEVVTCKMHRGDVLLLNNLIPHRSTENRSKIIRWSIDLRWQRPEEISGMEGIKDPIILRSSQDPAQKPDWSAWAAQSRQVGLRDVLTDKNAPIRPYDAKVTGPWMDRWKIRNIEGHAI